MVCSRLNLPWPLTYLWANSSWHLRKRKLGRPQRNYGRFGSEKGLLSLPELRNKYRTSTFLYMSISVHCTTHISSLCHNRTNTRYQRFLTVRHSTGERKLKFHVLNIYDLQNLPGFDLVSRNPRLEAKANNAISVVWLKEFADRSASYSCVHFTPSHTNTFELCLPF